MGLSTTRSLEVSGELVAALYEAAADPSKWSNALAWIGSELGASSGALYLEGQTSTPTFLAMPGWSDTALGLYREHYNTVDPYAVFARTHLSMSALLGQSVVSTDTYNNSEVWNDFARHHTGAFHIVGAAIPVSGGVSAKLAIHRPRDAQAFGIFEREFLESVLHHLRSALALHLRLQEERSLSSTRAALLDSISSGVLVLDSECRVKLLNVPGKELAQAVGIQLGARSRQLTTNPQLDALIQRVAKGGLG